MSGELSPEDRQKIHQLLREAEKRVRESPEFKAARGNPRFEFIFDDEEPAALLQKYQLRSPPYHHGHDTPHYDSLG
jgi:hypothetical protein